MSTSNQTTESKFVEANELLDLALKAAGGLDRWNKVQSIDVRVSLTGKLFQLKGLPEGVPECTMRINTRQPAVIISPYLRSDHRGYFTPDRVWIEDRSGQIIGDRSNPRSSFDGQTRMSPWDHLHLLYFIGYALWNYITIPFMLTMPGFEMKEIDPHQENGETWRCLHVKFPHDIPTHNNFQPGGEQTFFFNEEGLLQRVDYFAVGPAAHYCFDHTSFKGIIFPTLRRVISRPPTGPLQSAPTSVLIQVTHVVLT